MMLRNAILGFFVLAFAAASAAAAFDSAAWMPAIMLALVVAAIAFERRRYRGREGGGAREHLTPTPERFIDPETGRKVQVWADAAGARHYVEEPAPER
jgi:membrane protein implicated in regulation of membrane protease activity